MPPDQKVLFEISNLTKSFRASSGLFSKRKRHVVIEDFSFKIYTGECVALVGESGSGKTTIGRCLLRLVKPDRGQIWHDGADLLKLPEAKFRRLRPKFQMIFQDPSQALNPRQSVRAALIEPLKVWGHCRRQELSERAEQLLSMVGLEVNLQTRFPNELSGGQRQRVAIARAIATRPEFIIADEPTSSLDALSKRKIVALLKDLQQRLGLTLLLISHDLALVSEVSDRIAVLYRGSLVETASTRSLLSRPRHPYTKQLLGSAGLVPERNVKVVVGSTGAVSLRPESSVKIV